MVRFNTIQQDNGGRKKIKQLNSLVLCVITILSCLNLSNLCVITILSCQNLSNLCVITILSVIVFADKYSETTWKKKSEILKKNGPLGSRTDSFQTCYLLAFLACRVWGVKVWILMDVTSV
jgi:hypothetical protein